jgi:hypothetical protein
MGKSRTGQVAGEVMVPRARLELARLSTLDPKSSASANFATSARAWTHTNL